MSVLRRIFYALAWVLALSTATVSLWSAWISFAKPTRPDGNEGHTTIDFGGQYLMGRMLLEGHGQELYNRNYQRMVLTAAYPTTDQDPEAEHSDAENLLFWMMGTDHPKAPAILGSFAAPLAAQNAPEAAILLAAGQHNWREESIHSRGPIVTALTPLGASNSLEAVSLLAAGQDEWNVLRLKHVTNRRVGGPLYPPINAFVSAPVALLPPRWGYRLKQVLGIVEAFLAGLGVSYLSRRSICWSVATFIVMIFPGFMGSLNLGQNATLTLTILIWGWALIARDRPGWGGIVWGLLAFKPVWALSFLLVLVLTRRWRVAAIMVATAAGLVLLTLPFVGVHSWLDWLQVGKEAANLYTTDKNWVFLSRDVLGIPRRWMLDWREGMPKEPGLYPPDPAGPGLWWHVLFGSKMVPGWLLPALAGWAILLAGLEMTVRLAVLRKDQARAVTGPAPAFLLLGAWLCCYHFMYYDILLAALPVFLLFTDARRYLEPIYLVLVPLPGPALGAGLEEYYQLHPARDLPETPLLRPRYHNIWVVNRMIPSLVLLLILTQPLFPEIGLGGYYGTPWDTFVLMALWLWSGWLWVRDRKHAPRMNMVGAWYPEHSPTTLAKGSRLNEISL
jgi:arabinofuranan 3-O-arabinosyltransferase